MLEGSYKQLAFSANTASQNGWQRWVTCHQPCVIIQSKRGENWSLPVNSLSAGRLPPHGLEVTWPFLGTHPHLCKISRQTGVKNKAIWGFIPAL